jgi:hypothetical protein
MRAVELLYEGLYRGQERRLRVRICHVLSVRERWGRLKGGFLGVRELRRATRL